MGQFEEAYIWKANFASQNKAKKIDTRSARERKAQPEELTGAGTSRRGEFSTLGIITPNVLNFHPSNY